MKNLGNGVTRLENMALIYAITNLDQYKYGRSPMREYYFPIRSLSKAIDNVETFEVEYEQEDGLTR